MMSDKINEVADGLSEMESGFYQVRNLAKAARMMASADEMPKDAGAALDAVTDLICEKIAALMAERERLCKLAFAVVKAAA
jgi:acetate kinase